MYGWIIGFLNYLLDVNFKKNKYQTIKTAKHGWMDSEKIIQLGRGSNNQNGNLRWHLP